MRGVDVIGNDIHVVKVVSLYVCVLQLVFCGSEDNE